MYFVLIQVLLTPTPGEKPLDGNFIPFIPDLSVYTEKDASASIGMTMDTLSLCGASSEHPLPTCHATVKATGSFSLRKPVKKKNTIHIYKTVL